MFIWFLISSFISLCCFSILPLSSCLLSWHSWKFQILKHSWRMSLYSGYIFFLTEFFGLPFAASSILSFSLSFIVFIALSHFVCFFVMPFLFHLAHAWQLCSVFLFVHTLCGWIYSPYQIYSWLSSLLWLQKYKLCCFPLHFCLSSRSWWPVHITPELWLGILSFC